MNILFCVLLSQLWCVCVCVCVCVVCVCVVCVCGVCVCGVYVCVNSCSSWPLDCDVTVRKRTVMAVGTLYGICSWQSQYLWQMDARGLDISRPVPKNTCSPALARMAQLRQVVSFITRSWVPFCFNGRREAVLQAFNLRFASQKGLYLIKM